MSRAVFVVSSWLLLVSTVAGQEGEPSPPVAPEQATWPEPPFDAWVNADDVYLPPSASRMWPSVGLLRRGDVVRVARCVPSCDAPRAWAELEPFGAARLLRLAPMPRPEAAVWEASHDPYVYARVQRGGADAHVAPDPDSPVVEHHRTNDILAFRTGDEAPEGWLRRPDGTYISLERVKPETPSTFEGCHDPPPTFAFVRRQTPLVADDGTSRLVERYERFEVLGIEPDGRVRVPGGTLARLDVRLGRRRDRDPRWPTDLRWIHIDLDQQVLTAYEGDRLIFATMVSTGRKRRATPEGFFSVRRKIWHTRMRGAGGSGDPYFVDQVPWVQYLTQSVALHGAFWHDRFGQQLSHGCINLAFADARFLFEWSPPDIPEGWLAVHPAGAGLPSVRVRIERLERGFRPGSEVEVAAQAAPAPAVEPPAPVPAVAPPVTPPVDVPPP